MCYYRWQPWQKMIGEMVLIFSNKEAKAIDFKLWMPVDKVTQASVTIIIGSYQWSLQSLPPNNHTWLNMQKFYIQIYYTVATFRKDVLISWLCLIKSWLLQMQQNSWIPSLLFAPQRFLIHVDNNNFLAHMFHHKNDHYNFVYWWIIKIIMQWK